ncbi:zinc metalloproteinase PrtA [Listeria monocytogenes]|nr:zinc metalloproteinase PrtA [Listeria monocytogenes]EAC3861233.1 zinc metalloproteinase PrtA [Listeria monocytogenes]EAC5421144.1 zinc metalloproteinase PrtA [Listeria monocytogenes]EAC9300256.1 zinc metalloproteinase PrtA [Listeria monocytogenes]EAC9461166.1 zinc metalloproteinase PrtA [Listeria monocytogenes]
MKSKLICIIMVIAFQAHFTMTVKADSVGEEKLQNNTQAKKTPADLKALPDSCEAKDFYKNFKILDMTKDKLGVTHYTLALSSGGYLTDNDEIKVHVTPDNKITFINGDLQQGQLRITNQIKITEKNAIEKAFEAIGQSEAHVKSYVGNPVKEKEIILNSRTKRLVYNIKLIFAEPEVASWIVQVDAETGAILKKQNMLSEVERADTHKDFQALGKGANRFLQRPLHVMKINDLFYLVDRTHKGLIRTFDLKHNTDTSFGKVVSNKTNMFTDPEFSSAVDAHFYASEVYEYYKNVHQLESLDGKGGEIDSFVHYGLNCNNAFWDGQEILYGDGDKKNFKPFSCAKTIVGHELTHAVIQYSAGLEYEGQSGALNESFADVFGYFIAPNHWLIGEDVCVRGSRDGRIRSIKDPDKYNQAAHMKDYESLPITEEGDWGGVHYNSGIPNKAAYNTIIKLGKEKTEQLYFRALKYYLTKKSQFTDAKKALQQAAKDLYGEDASKKVAEAWEAVGVN